MQIRSCTEAELRVRYGFGDDPADRHDSILADAAWPRDVRKRFGLVGFIAA